VADPWAPYAGGLLGSHIEPKQYGIWGAMSDPQFYKDMGSRIYDAFAGGAKDVFSVPERWKDPNWTLRGMEAQAWQQNPTGEFNRFMAGPAGMAPLGATVFHGSPHRFDKFDASKIGTGEGNQAYGHGIYFSENQAVGNLYSRVIEKGKSGWQADAYKNPVFGTIAEESLRKIPDDILQRIEASWAANGPETAKKLAQLYFDKNRGTPHSDALHELVFKADWTAKRGNLYKVDLPDDQIAKMLDWDKPLSQQPENIRAAFDKVLSNDKVYQAWKTNGAYPHISGQVAYQRVVDTLGKAHGGTYGAQGAQSAAASDAMKAAGIPGIRYLDQGSRAGGKGTSNYVVFPGGENNLKILGRE